MPIDFGNVREVFPAPATENPFVGNPHYVLEAAALALATQILRVVPTGDPQQIALRQLRVAVDSARRGLEPLPPAEDARRRAQTLAPYCPTAHDVVTEMLQLADVCARDLLYDVGCGDGRIAIAAARDFGARAVGVDIDEALVLEAQEAAEREGVSDRVEFRVQDALTVDYTPATVVAMYLITPSMLQLRPILTRQLKPGARIVSNAFDMGDWEAKRFVAGTTGTGAPYRLYMWETDGGVREWGGRR